MAEHELGFTPMVSVVMPIRNEARFIKRSLGAVLSQSYPKERIEVIIADGLSTDNTREIIRQMPTEIPVTIIENPLIKQAPGLNLAIQHAKGEIIVRVDGHTIIASDYVQECVRALTETQAANVGGPMRPIGDTVMGKAIASAGKSPFAVPTAFHVSDKAQFTDTVYMGAWRQEIFTHVGLFNEDMIPNEDYELNYRIIKQGGQIYLTPRIRSEYFGRQTLPALARQYFSYGIGKVRTLMLHPASLKLRHLVAPLFVLFTVGGSALIWLHPLISALWVTVMLLYATLNLAFAIRQAAIDRVSVWRVSLAFLTIHFAWGSGFLFGLGQNLYSRAMEGRRTDPTR